MAGLKKAKEKSKEEMCHCGKPLHYTNRGIRAFVQSMIDCSGECAIVSSHEGSWYVPRHYIALHGITAEDLPKLGFRKAFR